MSTASRRRNGSHASCEPCRRSKTRCDHRQPICGRCRRRAQDTHCWYHPNPLTKSAPNEQSTVAAPSQNHTHYVSVRVAPQRLLIQPQSLPKFSSWPGVDHASQLPPSQTPPRVNVQHSRTKDDQIAVAVELLEQLRSLSWIETLVNEYFAGSQVPIVPMVLVQRMVSMILENTVVNELTKEVPDSSSVECGTETVRHVAEELLRKSSTEVNITSSTGIDDFCLLYSASNLRVETLGLIYTIAARAFAYSAAYNESNDENLMPRLLRCSNLSLRLARDIAPQTNDVMLWLAHDNMLFVTLMEGDASIGVWRRLGDLATDIYALGVHRESAQSRRNVPFFLAECRRRTYASVYHADKALANMLSRPIRMPKRYADCALPLDLADDALLAETLAEIDLGRSKLTEDGWNTDGQFRSTTWARIRAILSEFREELIEYAHMAEISTSSLRNLSERFHAAWESVPTYVKYTPSCWTEGHPVAACFMLCKIYLSYLHTHIQIYQLLAKTEPSAAHASLQISIDMFDTLLQMGNVRSRVRYMPRDLSTNLLTYGLPCANILINALEASTESDSSPTTPKFDQTKAIRNLSVFVSLLESVCEPQEANHVFCMQAGKSISQKLDHVLAKHVAPAPASRAERPGTNSHPTPLSGITPSGDTTLQTLDFATADLEGTNTLDLDDWNMNVDFGCINSPWNLS